MSNSSAILCTYFNKSASTNWAVAPHRDLSIPVQAKFNRPEWTHWTVKEAIPHVQAPLAVLSELLSVRLNLDPSSVTNGALKVAPGSHRHTDDDEPSLLCAGESGSALLMRPQLRHSSSKSTGHTRRVLQFLLAPSGPPSPARWYYAV